MTTLTLKSGSDAFVSSVRASKAYGGPSRLVIDSGAAESYLYFPLGGIPRDAVVPLATLTFYQWTTWSGTNTVNVHAITGAWAASKVTWNTKPTVAATATDTLVQTNAGLYVAWSFDVTDDVTAILAGTPNRGWRLTTTSTTERALRGFSVASYKPRLVVTYVVPPAAPTNLAPSAGAVSIAKPTLMFNAPRDMTALQIQLDEDGGDFSAPLFDSGEVASTVGLYNLATSAYAGLSDGVTIQWRVRVKNASLWSAYSSAVEFSRVNKPALAITDPGATTADNTPPIVWTFTGQTERRVILRDDLTGKVLNGADDSRWVATTATNHTAPKGATKAGQLFTIEVYARDSEDRETTPGDPDYAVATLPTQFVPTATVASADWVSVTQEAFAPWVIVRMSRTAVPDEWLIYRDGDIIARVDGVDTLFEAGNPLHTWVDWTADPNRTHEYEVAAVVNNEASSDNPTDTIVPEVKGLWIGDPDNDIDVMLLGDTDLSGAYGEDSVTHTPIGGDRVIRRVVGMRGYEGTGEGILADALGRTALDELEKLLLIKADPAKTYRLVSADMNIPAVFSNINPNPHRRGTNPTSIRRTVTFEFFQAGELPFEPLL